MSVDAESRQSVSSPAEQEAKTLHVAYDVADLVWVKLGGHPWWPSLIIRDPNDPTQCFTKISGTARAKRMYFVVFYGSTADFAWVAETAVFPYKGVAYFAEYAQEVVNKAPTKSQKEQLTERFQLKINMSRRDDWELAVKEADEALGESSEKRLEQIDPKIQFYTAKLRKSANVDRSSSSSDDDDDEVIPPPAKRRPTKKNEEKKRARPRLKDPVEESPWTKILLSRSNVQADNRVGFLTPFEENEIVHVLDRLRPSQTFDEAEQLARRRYQEILSTNLHRPDAPLIPDEWFSTFLFAHPILLVKHEHWFDEPSAAELLTNSHTLTLKQQLAVLAKFYQNQVEIRPAES